MSIWFSAKAAQAWRAAPRTTRGGQPRYSAVAIEAALTKAVGYAKINYLMLMMVDPHVHFHVIPRYEGTRSAAGVRVADSGWPGQPDLGSAVKLDSELDKVKTWLQIHFDTEMK